MEDGMGRMLSPGNEDKRTIVGGRPAPEARRRTDVPHGIEVLLKKAAVDGEFRSRFVADPRAAAGSIGLELTPGESAILAATPVEQIEHMVDRIEVPPAQKAVFRGRTAAAMLAIVAGTVAISCVPPPAPGGIRKELPEKQEESKQGEEDRPVFIAGIQVEPEEEAKPEEPPVTVFGIQAMPEEPVKDADEEAGEDPR